jgi:hypothetical protein
MVMEILLLRIENFEQSSQGTDPEIRPPNPRTNCRVKLFFLKATKASIYKALSAVAHPQVDRKGFKICLLVSGVNDSQALQLSINLCPWSPVIQFSLRNDDQNIFHILKLVLSPFNDSRTEPASNSTRVSPTSHNAASWVEASVLFIVIAEYEP